MPKVEDRVQAAAGSVAVIDAGEGLKVLQKGGYKTIGPKARDGAVVFDDVSRTGELPLGLIDDQQPGAYRLSKLNLPLFSISLLPTVPNRESVNLDLDDEKLKWRCEQTIRKGRHFPIVLF